jgi:hypothetical protein
MKIESTNRGVEVRVKDIWPAAFRFPFIGWNDRVWVGNARAVCE